MAPKQPGDPIAGILTSQQELATSVAKLNERFSAIAQTYDARLAKIAADISATDVVQLNQRLDAQGERFNEIDTKITEAKGLVEMVLAEASKIKAEVADEILEQIKPGLQKALDDWSEKREAEAAEDADDQDAKILALAQRVADLEENIGRRLSAIDGKFGTLYKLLKDQSKPALPLGKPPRDTWMSGHRLSEFPNRAPIDFVARNNSPVPGMSLSRMAFDVVKANPGILYEDVVAQVMDSVEKLGGNVKRASPNQIRDSLEALFGKRQITATKD